MKVSVKTLYADIELKQNGMELEIRSSVDDKRFGDCYADMSGLVWCKGKVIKKNGVRVPWEEFMEICWSKETLKAALSAAKSAKEKNTTKTVAVTNARNST